MSVVLFIINYCQKNPMNEVQYVFSDAFHSLICLSIVSILRDMIHILREGKMQHSTIR